MPRARRFDWSNLWLRVVSGLILAPAAVLIVWFGGGPFLVLVSVAVSLMSVEWALMAARPAGARVAVVMSASSSIRVVDGRDGVEKDCLNYNAKKLKCLMWAGAPPMPRVAALAAPHKQSIKPKPKAKPAPLPSVITQGPKSEPAPAPDPN